MPFQTCTGKFINNLSSLIVFIGVEFIWDKNEI